MRRKRKKVVKTTILLPPKVHQTLRIEAITKKVSMGELIVQKLKELEAYREKYGGVVKAEEYLQTPFLFLSRKKKVLYLL